VCRTANQEHLLRDVTYLTRPDGVYYARIDVPQDLLLILKTRTRKMSLKIKGQGRGKAPALAGDLKVAEGV
jgi:hypothetical protein